MNLKELRKDKDLTQVELALKLGVKNTTISMWESGKSVPSITKLQMLSQNLDCTIEDVVKAISKT